MEKKMGAAYTIKISYRKGEEISVSPEIKDNPYKDAITSMANMLKETVDGDKSERPLVGGKLEIQLG